MKNLMKRALIWGSALIAATLVPAGASAQDVGLNYDRLASLEEPIEFDLGQVTFEITGTLDAPLFAEFDNITGNDSVDAEFFGNVQVAASTQLANRWNVGAVYFGQYATRPFDVFMAQEDYTDNVAGFIGTSAGTVLGGNVMGQVRELTRRQRGVGNGFLAFDDFYGQLARWGGAYQGRFGPSTIGVVVDENADFELGTEFQRPIGKRDIRFSGRYREGRFTAADGITQFETNGAGLVGEFVYGSSLFDAGFGYERLESGPVELDRWFLSAGAQTQIEAVQLSAEAHYGQAAGDDEVSASVGAAYAVARGLSLNLGVNYRDARVETGGITLIQTDEVTALASVRFSF